MSNWIPRAVVAAFLGVLVVGELAHIGLSSPGSVRAAAPGAIASAAAQFPQGETVASLVLFARSADDQSERAERLASAEVVVPAPAPKRPGVPSQSAAVVVIPTPPPPPPPPPRPAAPAPDPATFVVDEGVWDALAKCESGGNWAINTGNGYYGGLQFDHSTWHGYGGGEYAEYPHQATREQQIAVAERLHAARGFQPWPACRAKLGLP